MCNDMCVRYKLKRLELIDVKVVNHNGSLRVDGEGVVCFPIQMCTENNSHNRMSNIALSDEFRTGGLAIIEARLANYQVREPMINHKYQYF